MLSKRSLTFLLLIVLSIVVNGTNAIGQSSVNVVKWAVEQNSTLRVQGKSNINSFTCNINKYAVKDTIIFANNINNAIKFSGNLHMNIEGFDCHNSLITNDLRKTLKAKEYPIMIIRFISLETRPSLQKAEVINGCIEVELAGVTKRFELRYSFSTGETGDMLLNGGRTFCFSDFKLSPPKKLAGLVKIKDEFVVNFQLILRAV